MLYTHMLWGSVTCFPKKYANLEEADEEILCKH